MAYSSILICFHDSHTDVFKNGLPLGVITDGEFKVHQLKNPDSTTTPVKIDMQNIRDVILAMNIITNTRQTEQVKS